MSRPTHLLRHEHRVIEQAMRALEGMCIRMKAGSIVPDEELSKLLDFIRNFADRIHHAKEVTHLFPALEQIGLRGESGPLAFLRNEHETERRLLAELELAVEDYRYNYSATEKFVAAALEFKEHLVEHIEQEDSFLFALAEEMLDDEVKDSLIHSFAAENAGAAEMTRRYEDLAEELEKNWSV
jgi:hemerythrin-like domain-containing protein